MRHAEDAGKRRTDFVTDGGEQSRLGGTVVFGFLSGLFAGLRDQAFAGDVARNALEQQPVIRRVTRDDIVPDEDALAFQCGDFDVVAVRLAARTECEADLLAGLALRFQPPGQAAEGIVGADDAAIHRPGEADLAEDVVNIGEEFRAVVLFKTVRTLPQPYGPKAAGGGVGGHENERQHSQADRKGKKSA
jgi:hypothetical protein